MAHLLLPGQDQPFGQGLGHLAELELPSGCGCRSAPIGSTGPLPRSAVGWSSCGLLCCRCRAAGDEGELDADGSGLYSPGSRANRPPWGCGRRPAAPGSAGWCCSVALASIAAIFDTDTTSRSSDRPQAASTGSGAVAADQARAAGRRCASGSRAAGRRAAARRRSRCSARARRRPRSAGSGPASRSRPCARAGRHGRWTGRRVAAGDGSSPTGRHRRRWSRA